MLIGGIRRSKNNFTTTNGKRVIWGSFGNNLESRFVRGERRSSR
jgi:hypothetical protein